MSEQAASTTQTNQQSSNQQSQSTSGDQGSGGGSQSTTTQQAVRPDYVPETFWDPATGVKTAEFTTHIGTLAARVAAEDARIAARPEKPTGYELKFSDTFKPDVAIKFDETDPRVAPMRALAHELNLDQPTFSRLLEIEAHRVIAENKAYTAAVAAEDKKLGANATARVTALKTWLTGALGADAAKDLLGDDKNSGLVVYSAAAIEHLEKLQAAMSNQGAAGYRNGGRESPTPPPRTPEEAFYPQQARKAS